MNKPTLLRLTTPSLKPHNWLNFQADGTISRVLVRIANALDMMGVADEVNGVIMTDYNQESQRLSKALRPAYRGRCFTPRVPVPGYPKGFLDRPDWCAQARPYWEREAREHWAGLHRLSSSGGMTAGLDVRLPSPGGGHMAMASLHEDLRREHFRDCLHVNVYPLPTKDRNLWKNLRAYPDYPNLATPTLVVDNGRPEKIDEAIPLLFALSVSGHRYTDRGQHNLAECFQHVIDVSPTMGLAAAEARLPLMPRAWHDALLGRQGGVNAQELPCQTADAVVRVLQPEALLTPAEAEPEDPQVLALGGMPVSMRGDAGRQEEYKGHVMLLVRERLKGMGQEYPSGLSVVWSSMVAPSSNGFQAISAIRLFPIRGKTPRDFVDEMLAADGEGVSRTFLPAYAKESWNYRGG